MSTKFFPHDKLLFSNRVVSVEFIQKKVCEVAGVDYKDFMLPDKKVSARKREVVNARQISMKIIKDRANDPDLRSKGFPTLSLASIGGLHAGRDHATTLHACKQVNNWLDIQDPWVTMVYNRTIRIITNLEEELDINCQEKTIFNTEK